MSAATGPACAWPANVRVNVGDAIITLKLGQSLSHYTGGPTDEGWSSHEVTWTYNAPREIAREYYSDGVDCDGRLSSCGENVWDGQELNEWGYPAWQDVSHSQRDYSAEAMGY